jgi:hypothetical protein
LYVDIYANAVSLSADKNYIVIEKSGKQKQKNYFVQTTR